MIGREDWLFMPVMKGMITADKLLDGTVDLDFIALLNEAIQVEQENVYRARMAQEKVRK